MTGGTVRTGSVRTVAVTTAVLALIVLPGCAGDEPAEDAADAPVEEVVRTDPFRVTGDFEGRSFVMTLCADSEQDVDVVPGPATLDLVTLHGELVPGDMPSETIFVDLLGEAIQDGDDVSFEVLEIYRAEWEGMGCGWEPRIEDVRFVTEGTEPFWSLHVSADTALLVEPEGETRGLVESIEGSEAAGWTVVGTIGETPFTLELDAIGCTNSMSGAYRHLEVTFTRDGSDPWRGCGFSTEGL